MTMIKGITIKLWDKIQTGEDGFGDPVYEEKAVDIDNVLVGEPATSDAVDILNLTGKRLAYTLAIPKGDTHEWENKRVSFFGEDFRTIGKPTQGIEENIPLDWNKKVLVERYE